MKKLLAFLWLLPCLSFAQQLITPATAKFDFQHLKAETLKHTWYMLRDTSRIKMGEVETIIDLAYQKDKLLIITKVKMTRANAPWTDSTVADRKSLNPIYHSSYNGQRSMRLAYTAKKVTVWHKDNLTGKTTALTDTLKGSYFDSNLYSQMVRWLPLKDGFRGTIQNYNYANEQSHGLTTVQVLDVKEVEGLNPYYEVTLLDNESKSNIVLFVRKSDRKLLKSKMEFGGRKMEME